MHIIIFESRTQTKDEKRGKNQQAGKGAFALFDLAHALKTQQLINHNNHSALKMSSQCEEDRRRDLLEIQLSALHKFLFAFFRCCLYDYDYFNDNGRTPPPHLDISPIHICTAHPKRKERTNKMLKEQQSICVNYHKLNLFHFFPVCECACVCVCVLDISIAECFVLFCLCQCLDFMMCNKFEHVTFHCWWSTTLTHTPKKSRKNERERDNKWERVYDDENNCVCVL